MKRSWADGVAAVVIVLGIGQTLLAADAFPPEQKPAAPAISLPVTPYRYADIPLPAHFKTFAARRFDNTPSDNPITDAGATLGRVLFYDARLSANSSVSCSTCHVQQYAFTDPQRFSSGFEGKHGDRRALPLVEARYYPDGKFFWDERAPTLEDQTLMPIQSKSEMGQDLNKLVEILSNDPIYGPLFLSAFGDPKVTSTRISKALAQFVRSIVSYQSKYDEGRATATSVRVDFKNFTAEENRGKGLFLRNCGQCHMPDGQDAHFVTDRPKNTSLDAGIRVRDNGVGDITLNASEMGMFKSPSLRNIEFTGPYMHDGRFQTLDAVMNFYSRGGGGHPNRSPEMRRFNLNPQDRTDLIAFLLTLSDRKLIEDPRFSDPFVVHPQAVLTASASDKGSPIFASNDSDFRGFGGRGNRGRGQGGGPPPPRGPRGGRGPAITVDNVTDHLMSFDRNGDNKLTADELPERMQAIVARGDTSHEGALTRDEVKEMAGQAFKQGPPPGPLFPPPFGGPPPFGRGRGNGPPPPPPGRGQ